MNAFRTTLAAASIGLASIATGAAADDKATVQAFYDLLSNPGSEAQVAAFLSATSENWESVGDYSGDNEGRDGFVGQMGFFSQLIQRVLRGIITRNSHDRSAVSLLSQKLNDRSSLGLCA